jgi:hypothetical protein
MLVKYDYSKDGIIPAEEALRRLCNSDLIDSLQSMCEMDGDMLDLHLQYKLVVCYVHLDEDKGVH